MVAGELQCASLATENEGASPSTNSQLSLEHGNQNFLAVIFDPVAELPLVRHV